MAMVEYHNINAQEEIRPRRNVSTQAGYHEAVARHCTSFGLQIVGGPRNMDKVTHSRPQ